MVKYKEKLRMGTSEVLFKCLLNNCAEEKARNWVGLPPERGLGWLQDREGWMFSFHPVHGKGAFAARGECISIFPMTPYVSPVDGTVQRLQPTSCCCYLVVVSDSW